MTYKHDISTTIIKCICLAFGILFIFGMYRLAVEADKPTDSQKLQTEFHINEFVANVSLNCFDYDYNKTRQYYLERPEKEDFTSDQFVEFNKTGNTFGSKYLEWLKKEPNPNFGGITIDKDSIGKTKVIELDNLPYSITLKRK